MKDMEMNFIYNAHSVTSFLKHLEVINQHQLHAISHYSDMHFVRFFCGIVVVVVFVFVLCFVVSYVTSLN